MDVDFDSVNQSPVADLRFVQGRCATEWCKVIA